MRDPFDSAPALRLGDAPAKKLIAESRAARETGIIPNAEIVAIEPPKTETAIPWPPSLDPAFADAFGEALSKPKTHRGGLVDWIEKHGAYDPEKESLALEVERMVKAVSEAYAVPMKLLKGPDPEALTATQKAELDRYFARLAMPVGDGATRYEFPPPLMGDELAAAIRGVVSEILSEEDRYLATLSGAIGIPEGELRDILNRNYGPKFPINHGDTSAASLVANHAALVAKKDAPK